MTRINLKTKHFIAALFIGLLFSACSEGYKVENNKVYYRRGFAYSYQQVKDADAETFSVFEKTEYGIDKRHAYFGTQLVLNADVKTFEPVCRSFGKDKRHAFCGAKKIANADGRSFEQIKNSSYFRDKKDCYYDTIALNVTDVSSFVLLDRDGFVDWAKDRTHYYIRSKKYPLADYESFVNIANGYAKDKYNVYFQDTIVAHADPKTFRTKEYAYGYDKESMFNGRKRLHIRDTLTFKRLFHGYSKDKFNVYFEDSIVENADHLTFETINYLWAKDKNTIFRHGKPMKETDPETFVLLIAGYAKDKNRVYFNDKLIVGADPSTFVVNTKTFIAKDKYACYKNEKRIDCDEPGR